MGEIYRLDFANGKSYIGLTELTAAERLWGHRCRAQKGDTALYHAWRKYGEPTLVVLKLSVPRSKLGAAERATIRLYNTMAPNGYNVIDGGNVSPMTFPHIAAKTANALRGRKLSKAHRAALSAAQRGKPRPWHSAALLGKKLSAATRAKMSRSAKRLKRTPEHIARLRISAAKARAVRMANVLARKERK